MPEERKRYRVTYKGKEYIISGTRPPDESDIQALVESEQANKAAVIAQNQAALNKEQFEPKGVLGHAWDVFNELPEPIKPIAEAQDKVREFLTDLGRDEQGRLPYAVAALDELGKSAQKVDRSLFSHGGLLTSMLGAPGIVGKAALPTALPTIGGALHKAGIGAGAGFGALGGYNAVEAALNDKMPLADRLEQILTGGSMMAGGAAGMLHGSNIAKMPVSRVPGAAASTALAPLEMLAKVLESKGGSRAAGYLAGHTVMPGWGGFALGHLLGPEVAKGAEGVGAGVRGLRNRLNPPEGIVPVLDEVADLQKNQKPNLPEDPARRAEAIRIGLEQRRDAAAANQEGALRLALEREKQDPGAGVLLDDTQEFAPELDPRVQAAAEEIAAQTDIQAEQALNQQNPPKTPAYPPGYRARAQEIARNLAEDAEPVPVIEEPLKEQGVQVAPLEDPVYNQQAADIANLLEVDRQAGPSSKDRADFDNARLGLPAEKQKGRQTDVPVLTEEIAPVEPVDRQTGEVLNLEGLTPGQVTKAKRYLEIRDKQLAKAANEPNVTRQKELINGANKLYEQRMERLRNLKAPKDASQSTRIDPTWSEDSFRNALNFVSKLREYNLTLGDVAETAIASGRDYYTDGGWLTLDLGPGGLFDGPEIGFKPGDSILVRYAKNGGIFGVRKLADINLDPRVILEKVPPDHPQFQDWPNLLAKVINEYTKTGRHSRAAIEDITPLPLKESLDRSNLAAAIMKLDKIIEESGGEVYRSPDEPFTASEIPDLMHKAKKAWRAREQELTQKGQKLADEFYPDDLGPDFAADTMQSSKRAGGIFHLSEAEKAKRAASVMGKLEALRNKEPEVPVDPLPLDKETAHNKLRGMRGQTTNVEKLPADIIDEAVINKDGTVDFAQSSRTKRPIQALEDIWTNDAKLDKFTEQARAAHQVDVIVSAEYARTVGEYGVRRREAFVHAILAEQKLKNPQLIEHLQNEGWHIELDVNPPESFVDPRAGEVTGQANYSTATIQLFDNIVIAEIEGVFNHELGHALIEAILARVSEQMSLAKQRNSNASINTLIGETGLEPVINALADLGLEPVSRYTEQVAGSPYGEHVHHFATNDISGNPNPLDARISGFENEVFADMFSKYGGQDLLTGVPEVTSHPNPHMLRALRTLLRFSKDQPFYGSVRR